MLKELSENHKELSGNNSSMKKEIETINKNQKEMKNKISEIKTHTHTYTHTRKNYNQAE